MAKRFTDTNKWAKSSFSELSLKMKLVWIYLCDNCDHAGVWDINLGLMSFHIGSKVLLSEIESAFGDKVEKRDNKLFIPSFIEFQYGELNSDNKVHRSVISRIEKLAPCKPLDSPLHGAKDKDKEKDKDKDKYKERDKDLIENSAFESAFKKYPLQIKGPDAAKRFNEQIKTPQDESDLNKALDNYASFLAQPANSWRQPKQSFATFLGTKASGYFWRDFINAVSSSTKPKSEIEKWAEDGAEQTA